MPSIRLKHFCTQISLRSFHLETACLFTLLSAHHTGQPRSQTFHSWVYTLSSIFRSVLIVPSPKS